MIADHGNLPNDEVAITIGVALVAGFALVAAVVAFVVVAAARLVLLWSLASLLFFF